MRNIGGRITPAVLRSWASLAKLGQARPSGQAGGGPPHMVILHHTDCGIKTLANYPELLAEYFEIPVEELDTKAIGDPHAAVENRRRHRQTDDAGWTQRLGSGL